MSIWFKDYKIEDIQIPPVGIDELLEIEIIELGSDFIKTKMPVNSKTKQPLGLLHGGASCVLAESTASVWDVPITNEKKELISQISFTAMHKDN